MRRSGEQRESFRRRTVVRPIKTHFFIYSRMRLPLADPRILRHNLGIWQEQEKSPHEC